ncbi:MAG: histidine kinase [Syntrophomonadaceae bacterium]|nr:histidine kinase [Syntrophomonadaceae bacterium]
MNSVFENVYLRLISLAIYIITCFYLPDFLLFIPLIAYDILLSRWQFLVLLIVIPLAVNYHRVPSITCLLLVLLIALAWLMKFRAQSSEKISHEYIELRDSAKEFSLQLEGKNQELMERQDYEINLATLQERNRIAREIHDNVGHLLSSSILQIGALMSRYQDESLKESLNTLKMTLLQGMDSIRDSIHDLYDESLDLYSEIHTLIEHFRFCPVVLDYGIENNPDRKIKYAFIAIMKEALSNIMKHSDASQVHITLREHPVLYQLIIRDNGSKKAMNPEGGIGLKNIGDRVNNLGGNINISNDTGFMVFISIPMEGSYENHNRG